MKNLLLNTLLVGALFFGVADLAEAKSPNADKAAVALAAALPQGVTAQNATAKQMATAFKSALKGNKKLAVDLLDRVLHNKKLAKNTKLVTQCAVAAIKVANPVDLANIVSAIAKASPAAAIAAATAAVKKSPGMALAIINSVSFLTPAQQLAVAKAMITAVPSAATTIKRAVAANTRGRVNSNDV